MASKKLYSPPILAEIEEMEEWLRELEIWQAQGAMINLSLTDKIRKSCHDISIRDLNKDDGLDILVRKIKSLYAKDTNTLVLNPVVLNLMIVIQHYQVRLLQFQQQLAKMMC